MNVYNLNILKSKTKRLSSSLVPLLLYSKSLGSLPASPFCQTPVAKHDGYLLPWSNWLALALPRTWYLWHVALTHLRIPPPHPASTHVYVGLWRLGPWATSKQHRASLLASLPQTGALECLWNALLSSKSWIGKQHEKERGWGPVMPRRHPVPLKCHPPSLHPASWWG